jgi:mannose-6-phosphate isomerase-like protein (cupin superfamily)
MVIRSQVSAAMVVALACLAVSPTACTKYEDRMLGNLAGGPLARDWKSLARAYEKEPQVNILNLGAGRFQSSHLFVIPGSLASQLNPENDLTFTILKGKGIATVQGETMNVKKGAVVFVPRGDTFNYQNKGRKPTLALAIFSPPYEQVGTNRPDMITPPGGLR